MKKQKFVIKGLNPQNEAVEGDTIEMQVERLVENKEPIPGEAPLRYTERKDGIRAEFNIRTDRFEIAIDAMDKVAKSYKARREERLAQMEVNKDDDDGGAKSIQGTKGEANK